MTCIAPRGAPDGHDTEVSAPRAATRVREITGSPGANGMQQAGTVPTRHEGRRMPFAQSPVT